MAQTLDNMLKKVSMKDSTEPGKNGIKYLQETVNGRDT